MTPYDNSARLLYDMQTYSVDMCIIRPAMTFGMNNELNAALVEKHPDKFAALCTPRATFERALKGEIEWSIEEACKELDRLLSTGKYVGIGEGMPIRSPDTDRGQKADIPGKENGPDARGHGGRKKTQGPHLLPYGPHDGLRAEDVGNLQPHLGP